jgi:small subunit ribosomal protein S20
VAERTQPAKRHRQSLKRKTRNYAYRSRLRTYVKQARDAIVADAKDKEELVGRACRELDRLVTKGVIHKNAAARRKSRLERALQGVGAGRPEGAEEAFKAEGGEAG